MSTDSNTPNYRIYDQTGSHVTKDIYATDPDDAIEQGRAWIEAGDWSSEAGKYETVKLDCSVREIVRVAYYVDHYSPGTARDLRGPMTEDDARAQCDGVEVQMSAYDGVIARIAESNSGAAIELVEAWADDEDAEGYRAIYQVKGQSVDGEIDPAATDDGDAWDCSGTHTDELPECEAAEDGEHDWHCPHEIVGGLRDNPGVWSTGGTRTRTVEVCACCGVRKTTRKPGCQRNDDEALETVTLEDRTPQVEAWMVEHHEEDGWIPDWLAEYLDRTPTTKYSKEQAREYVAQHDDDDLDADNLEHVFAALHGRRATDSERQDGLWSHCCAYVL